MSKLTPDQLREGRVAKRMTMHQLAKQIGITAPKLSAVEHGRNVLTDEQDTLAQKILEVKPRVSERGCIGYGGTYESAIKAAFDQRRFHNINDTDIPNCRLVVDQHYIEPWINYNRNHYPEYGFRHVVVLRKAR